MAGFITFQNVAITNIIEDINVKSDRDYNTSPYIGGTGSNTNFVSELGRVISFKSLVPSYEELSSYEDIASYYDGDLTEDNINSPITTYKRLANEYKNKTGVLTSTSHINLKGNYLCTGFDIVEDTGNNFTISWEFTEVLPFNSVKKTFQVWGSASSNSNKQSKTAQTSGNKLSKSSKTLLKKCGTLGPSTKVRKCVKYLQKFMQSLGYYKKYKVDGKFGSKTKNELKKLQKSRKLKKTGKWDRDTLKYFQKKYKIKTK